MKPSGRFHTFADLVNLAPEHDTFAAPHVHPPTGRAGSANAKVGVAKRVTGIIGHCHGAQARLGLRGGSRFRVLSAGAVTPTSIVCRTDTARRQAIGRARVARHAC
jgi:hypothetical protein